MPNPTLLGIAQNVVFLLAVALVFDLVTGGRPLKGHPVRRIGTGLLLGLLAVGTMATALEFEPGVFFDARSVVLAITGLFFGPWATLPAVAVAGAYRALEGGPGMWTGLAVIGVSGSMGLAWCALRARSLRTMRAGELLLFGFTVHLGVLALFFTLPDGRAWQILPAVTVPVLALYPLATALLGLLIVRRLVREYTIHKLAESESRYRSLFEESQSVMLIVDPRSGRITASNAAAQAFYGYDAETLAGLRIHDINTLPGTRVEEEMARARSGRKNRFHFQHRRADGSIRDVEVHSAPIPVEGRELLYSIVHDVTEQRRAEAALEVQAETLRLQGEALEAADNPIVITDRDGRIEWVNRAFCELTGYSRGEALGRNPSALIGSGVQDEPFFADLWSTILSGEVWRGELTNRRKDGTLYQEAQTITPVRNRHGEITHFIAIKQDLTERLELQAQLLQAQKMEAVGQFAGGIAHDFNNLLTVMNGSAELALESATPGTPLHDEVLEIRGAGDRAAALTRQLLAFSRRKETRPERVELNEVVRSTVHMLRRLLSEDITVALRLSEDPTVVHEDPSQLEQVILNLAVNARDAMPQGGTLTIRTGRTEDGDALLRVEDTGEGMTEEVRARIFEPFFTTKPEGRGTGLGLAMVHEIVSRSGGGIAVTSRPAEGTTFEIRLPGAKGSRGRTAPVVGTEEAPAGGGPPSVDPFPASGNGGPPAGSGPAPEDGPPTGNGKRRILLVEDDDAIRRIAERILGRSGYEVVSTDCARGALELVAEGSLPFDLVLTDVVLPDMTGPSLVEALRVSRPDLRVIFSSGYAAEVLERSGVDAGTSHFLAKPYTITDLTGMVHEALASERGGRRF